MNNYVVITGGAGYIGSHTAVELYEGGYTPIIIDNFSNTTIDNIRGIENITDLSAFSVCCPVRQSGFKCPENYNCFYNPLQ